MKTVVAHVENIEAQLKQWGVKLDELVAKAGQVTAETKAEYRVQLNDLKEKHRIAQTKLGELKASHRESGTPSPRGSSTPGASSRSPFRS